jgi:hypothetical protein
VRDPKAAAELATRLLAAVNEARGQPAFQAVLCEKAYELTAPYPSSQPPAIEARAKELAQAAMTVQEIEALKKQLEANPADASVREKLALLYLVWLDDPAMAAKDVVQGVWRREEAAVTTTSKGTEGGPACVMLPVAPRGDYELEVRFVRKSENGAVEIPLPVGPTAVAVSLSRNFGEASGLELVGGKRPPDNETSVKPGALENNHEYTLVCKVSVVGNNVGIGVTLDGKPIISWRGPLATLSLHPNLRWPHPECPGLGAFHDPLVFKSARLRMLSGEAKPLRP